MPPADSPRAMDAAPPAVRDAFRELHGRRLHGFALLLTLGDAPRAARLAGEALAAGTLRLDELRHPERAAAWLRATVVDASRHAPRHGPRRGDRLEFLAALGVDGPVAAGLEALDHLERAALIAVAIERLDRRDAATIVGRGGRRLERLLTRARRRYAAAHAAVAGPAPPSGGPLSDRVHQVAMRAMA